MGMFLGALAVETRSYFTAELTGTTLKRRFARPMGQERQSSRNAEHVESTNRKTAGNSINAKKFP